MSGKAGGEFFYEKALEHFFYRFIFWG